VIPPLKNFGGGGLNLKEVIHNLFTKCAPTRNLETPAQIREDPLLKGENSKKGLPRHKKFPRGSKNPPQNKWGRGL